MKPNSMKLYGNIIQSGFSLVEILITLIILAIILVMIGSYQMLATKNMQLSLQRSIAITQIQSMHERLLANPFNPMNELNLWNLENQFLLPSGKGKISGTENPSIELTWQGNSKRKREKL